jgi:tetratricopeptide (TPR) repeat protein
MISRLMSGLAILVISALAVALYIPFLGNPLVFDDLPFFFEAGFAHYATSPFGLRLPAYFTIAFPQVMWGQFPPWNDAELHRVISLAFHIACGIALYRFLHGLILATRAYSTLAGPDSTSYRDAQLLALVGAVAFVIHPVAVYGAGYLVQRTIVMATLFSLLSAIFFMRGLTSRNHMDAMTAALLYSVAVFCKEHSLLLPAAVIPVAILVSSDRRFATRHTLFYLLACLPAALAVLLTVRGVIGHAYEPHVEQLLDQIEGIPVLNFPGGAWFVSAITQAGLFFVYLATWLLPDTARMSIDLRVDFAATWSAAWIVLKVAGFAAFGATGFYLLTKQGRVGLFGFGMLYAWILYFVEFGSVRFQEPFVLYRSYLWAPGFLMLLTAMLSALPRKLVVAFILITAPLLLYQAHDRLQSFSSSLALWTDAAAKLPESPVPGAPRVLFGVARELVYIGRLDLAAQAADRCITQYPQSAHCRFSRGAVFAQHGDYAQALEHFERAVEIQPNAGPYHMHRGIALERLGRIEEARQAYIRAADLGFMGGDFRLSLLDEPDPGTGKRRVLYDASRVRK